MAFQRFLITHNAGIDSKNYAEKLDISYKVNCPICNKNLCPDERGIKSHLNTHNLTRDKMIELRSTMLPKTKANIEKNQRNCLLLSYMSTKSIEEILAKKGVI